MRSYRQFGICGQSDSRNEHIAGLTVLDTFDDLNALKQFFEREPQRFRDLLDIHQSHVPLSAFNSTHIGAIKTTPVRELFLRHP